MPSTAAALDSGPDFPFAVPAAADLGLWMLPLDGGQFSDDRVEGWSAAMTASGCGNGGGGVAHLTDGGSWRRA